MPAITDDTRVLRIRAPAKINLTLHVTGQREDGYHLLDSLVVFAAVGDELCLHPAEAVSLTTDGPEAASVPADGENLVLKVAQVFDGLPGAALRLTKSLPVASGIGGGSADAAAAFRGLMCHMTGGAPGESLPEGLLDPARHPLAGRLLALGADIPACLMSRAVRMRGIGERLTPVPDLPVLFAVLANPRREVATPAIFRALTHKANPPMPDGIPRFSGAAGFARWLQDQRNDLEPAAATLEPEVSRVLAALSGLDGCLLARMSGSGATCFGLFGDQAGSDRAADALRLDHPEWWVRSTWLGTMTGRAMPRFS